MSEIRISYGAALPINITLNKARVEEINEAFDHKKSNVFVNYEGTIAFVDLSDKDDIYGHLTVMKTTAIDAFLQSLYDMHLPVHPQNMLPYSAFWHDGTDSPMKEVTIEQYKSQIAEAD